ncbi:hypothetical protein [Nocardia pseudobrasiliensis]|nr:hypothetical protein [Nocardia pseudobrasiliensis]
MTDGRAAWVDYLSRMFNPGHDGIDAAALSFDGQPAENEILALGPGVPASAMTVQGGTFNSAFAGATATNPPAITLAGTKRACTRAVDVKFYNTLEDRDAEYEPVATGLLFFCPLQDNKILLVVQKPGQVAAVMGDRSAVEHMVAYIREGLICSIDF